MKVQHQNLPDSFGAEVIEVDVREFLGDHEASTNLRDLLHAKSVLVFPQQKIGPSELVAFSSIFGRLEPCPDPRYQLMEHEDILVVGNKFVGDDPQEAMFTNGGIEWHYDYAQNPKPALASLLYAIVVPQHRGDTLYADTRAAFRELDPSKKEQALKAYAAFSSESLNQFLDDADTSREPGIAPSQPSSVHPIVQRHPVTEEPAILLAPEIMTAEMGTDSELLQELLDHCTQDRFVYRHKWKKGDLVFHDNRSTIHSATPIGDPRNERIMYRTTIMPN